MLWRMIARAKTAKPASAVATIRKYQTVRRVLIGSAFIGGSLTNAISDTANRVNQFVGKATVNLIAKRRDERFKRVVLHVFVEAPHRLNDCSSCQYMSGTPHHEFQQPVFSCGQ